MIAPFRSRSARPGRLQARSRSRRAVAVSVLSLCALAGAPLRAEPPAEPDFADALQQQVHRLFEKSHAAVVRIEASDNHGQLAGTGFFIDPNGTLLTSYTIGGDTRDVVVLIGDLKYPAQRVIADSRSGVAILKVDVKTAFLPLGSSHDLQMGSPVMTIGYPMDLPLTPSFGVLGGFDRKYLGLYFATTHLRANVPVQRGEGGAPLLNMKGEVVGLLISSLDQGSASFALPVEAIEKVRKDYVRFGELRPGWIGLSVEATDPPQAGSSAQVQDVFPNSPAQKAGLLPQDIILRIGQTKITCPEDMLDACFFLTAEDQVKIAVERGEKQMEFQVETAEVPGRHPLHDGLGSTGEVPKFQAEEKLSIGK